MNAQAKLAPREREVLEHVAWGASQKEVAAELGISVHTVDNTVRHIKEKLKLQKSTELSAWYFCTTFNISFDLSPLKRKLGAVMLVVLLLHGEFFNGWQFCRFNEGRPVERKEAVRREDLFIE